MDLSLVMEKLRPGENVSPDMSSYEAMAAKWRGTGSVPSKAECEAKWAEILSTKTEDEKIAEELFKQSISLEDRIVALEKKIMENNSIEADAIQAIKEDVKA